MCKIKIILSFYSNIALSLRLKIPCAEILRSFRPQRHKGIFFHFLMDGREEGEVMYRHRHLHPCLMRVCLALLTAFMLGGCGFLGPQVDNGPPPEKAQRIVATAYKQMGKNYRLGGASPQKGFDCSGLIWWAYKQNGVSIPRVTSDQARTGVKIPSGMARAGDIVVFRTGNSPRGLHTGIYTGDNEFIHSPRRGEKVRVESLDEPHWRKRLIAVRRVL